MARSRDSNITIQIKRFVAGRKRIPGVRGAARPHHMRDAVRTDKRTKPTVKPVDVAQVDYELVLANGRRRET